MNRILDFRLLFIIVNCELTSCLCAFVAVNKK